MSDTTRVWLLRHAETATPMVFHGAESDEPLSDYGHRQAAAAAEWFRAMKPDVVISSKMRRAIDTAAPIAKACRVEHLLENDFYERRVGILGGTPFSLAEGPWVETLKHWTTGDTAYTTTGAESYDELCARLILAWNRVIDTHRGKRIVVVAHGIVCKILLLTLLPGWGPTRWHELGKVANLAVSELSLASTDAWQAHRLIEVPPPVAALAESAAITRSTA